MIGFGGGHREPLDHDKIAKILGSTYRELANPPAFGGPVDLTPAKKRKPAKGKQKKKGKGK